MGLHLAPSGVAVFDVATDGKDVNVTQAKFSRVADEVLWVGYSYITAEVCRSFLLHC